jgi:hypothetical protein
VYFIDIGLYIYNFELLILKGIIKIKNINLRKNKYFYKIKKIHIKWLNFMQINNKYYKYNKNERCVFLMSKRFA